MKNHFGHRQPYNALEDYRRIIDALSPPPLNALKEYREPKSLGSFLAWPKTEWVSGHYRVVPDGFGYRYEWIDGYWRSED